MNRTPEAISWLEINPKDPASLPSHDDLVLGFREDWPCGETQLVYWDQETATWRTREGFLMSEEKGEAIPDLLPPSHWAEMPVGPGKAPRVFRWLAWRMAQNKKGTGLWTSWHLEGGEGVLCLAKIPQRAALRRSSEERPDPDGGGGRCVRCMKLANLKP
jgi:hypothetical protein